MKEITNKFIIISTVIAFVVMYLFFINKQGATQELALMNAVGGGVGMAVGLIIYRIILRKEQAKNNEK